MTWDDHINRTCTEAGKRLTIIKRLPYNVTPLTKIHIYKTFIRPILEYGAIIFDNCPNYLTQKMENIQRQAAIAATRAYNNTSHQQLLLECGIVTLQTRRTQAKLINFYKIKKNIAPAYLLTLLPDEVGNQSNYNLRNTLDIQLPKSTKNYYLKSYIPSSIKLWNKLTQKIKTIATIDTFKLNLKHIYCKTETYKPYLTGSTPGYIHLSRFRMQLSGLNTHRKKFHFIDYNTCPNCNRPNEDPEHFFLICPAYAVPRGAMFDRLGRLLPSLGVHGLAMGTGSQRRKIVKILIFGCKKVEIDTKIFNISAKYVEETNRFI